MAVRFFRPASGQVIGDRADVHTTGSVAVSIRDLVSLRMQAASLPLRRGRVRGRHSGQYLAPFKGRGMEFEESRPYEPGDDSRNLDWRVTARTGKPHTKLFCEERERPVFLWVDYRVNMFFATRGLYKAVIAAHLASLLGWSALHRGDRVGGLIFSDDVHHEVRPRRGTAAMLHVIDALVNHPAWKHHPVAHPQVTQQAMVRLRRLARPGSLIFLISDFRGLDPNVQSDLVRISRHSDVIMLFITDPLERDLPPPGLYRMTNGSQALLLDTYNARLRDAYKQHFQERETRLRALARQPGVFLLLCATIDDPFAVLHRGLGGRP